MKSPPLSIFTEKPQSSNARNEENSSGVPSEDEMGANGIQERNRKGKKNPLMIMK